MRRCWMLIGALVALAAGAAAQSDYLDAAALRQAGLSKYWQLDLPLVAGTAVRDAYLVDDQIYVGTDDGYVYAIHADTGVVRWLRQVTGPSYRLRRPAHAGDEAIFTIPTTARIFDRYYGEEIAKNEFDFPAGSAPASDGTLYFVGGIDRRIHAFDVATQFEIWQALTGGPIEGQPAMFREYVFVPSTDGRVYAAEARTKRKLWISNAVGALRAGLVANVQGVFAASIDRSLYLLDPIFGKQRWRARFSGPLLEAPVVVGDRAYQYCADDGLCAVDTTPFLEDEDLRIRWKLPQGRYLLTVDEQHAYVLTMSGTVLQVRQDDGTVAQTIPARGFSFGLSSPENTSIYLIGRDGRLFCARPIGTPIVSAADVRSALLNPADRTGPGSDEPVLDLTRPAPIDRGDTLQSRSAGPPVGGKSQVSKQYGREGGGQ